MSDVSREEREELRRLAELLARGDDHDNAASDGLDRLLDALDVTERERDEAVGALDETNRALLHCLGDNNNWGRIRAATRDRAIAVQDTVTYPALKRLASRLSVEQGVSE